MTPTRRGDCAASVRPFCGNTRDVPAALASAEIRLRRLGRRLARCVPLVLVATSGCDGPNAPGADAPGPAANAVIDIGDARAIAVQGAPPHPRPRGVSISRCETLGRAPAPYVRPGPLAWTLPRPDRRHRHQQLRVRRRTRDGVRRRSGVPSAAHKRNSQARHRKARHYETRHRTARFAKSDRRRWAGCRRARGRRGAGCSGAGCPIRHRFQARLGRQCSGPPPRQRSFPRGAVVAAELTLGDSLAMAGHATGMSARPHLAEPCTRSRHRTRRGHPLGRHRGAPVPARPPSGRRCPRRRAASDRRPHPWLRADVHRRTGATLHARQQPHRVRLWREILPGPSPGLQLAVRGITEVGQYEGKLPVPTTFGVDTVSLHVRVTDALWWPLLALLFGLGLAVVSRRYSDVRRAQWDLLRRADLLTPEFRTANNAFSEALRGGPNGEAASGVSQTGTADSRDDAPC